MRWIAAVPLLASAAPAVAQDVAAPEPPAEIVVTAERRQETAGDVGVALSVVTPEALTRAGASTVNDLQNLVPNLEVEPAFGSSQAEFRIRGVGFQDYASNNAPTVGVYVNEVAYPVPIMTQGLIFDVARVEVLRGPQGTLYGRNTTGGAINFVTSRPTETPEAGGFVEGGRFGQLRAQGFVSGPLGGGLALRVAAATEDGGGYQKSRDTGEGLGDANRQGVRGLLSYKGGAVDALLDVHGGRDHSEGIGLYLLDDFQTTIRPAVTDPNTGEVVSPAVLGPIIPADRNHRLTGWDIPPNLARDADLPGDKPGRRNGTWGSSLEGGIDLGGAKLTSLSSYDHLNRREYGDYDASDSIEGDVFFGSRVSVAAEELRLASTGTGALTWLVGGYASDERLHERYFSDFTNDYGTYARVTYTQRVRAVAGFGQLDWRFAPTLDIVAGLRAEHERRTLDGFGSAFGGSTALPPTTLSTAMNPLTGKLELEWKPHRGLLVYASASKGVKSGGFTTYNTGSASGIAPFKPERLYAYEAGAKATITPTLQIDGAAYYYDYRDQQVLDAVCGTTGPVGKFANAPRSRIYGLEADASWRPAPGLTLSPFASWKHGDYLDYQSLDVAACRATHVASYVDHRGDRIPFPKVEAGGTVAYAFDAGGWRITPSATWSYRSRYYSWLGPEYDIPHYWLVDADLTFAPAGARWSASLWGRNVLNTHYDLTRNFYTTSNVAQPGRPLSYGIRLAFHT